jgi:hypothetical protein
MNLRLRLKRLLSALRDKPWSLGIALGMMLFFLPHPDWHGDLYLFREVEEILEHPYWAHWLFALLRLPSEPVAYLLLSITCIAFLYYAQKVFGGKHWMVFTSFAFAWTLIYGQIDAIVVGGIALAWWAVQKERPVWLGLGLALASLKPHLTLPLGVLLWWWSPSRLKSLIVPGIVFALSLLSYGFWVPEWIRGLMDNGYMIELTRNLSIYPETGYWIWLLWPLVYALPLERPRKLIAVAAATALTLPYFPLPSAVLFLTMPVPVWVYWLLQIPALGAWLGHWLYLPMKVVPPLLLLWAVYPLIRRVVFNTQDS